MPSLLVVSLLLAAAIPGSLSGQSVPTPTAPDIDAKLAKLTPLPGSIKPMGMTTSRAPGGASGQSFELFDKRHPSARRQGNPQRSNLGQD